MSLVAWACMLETRYKHPGWLMLDMLCYYRQLALDMLAAFAHPVPHACETVECTMQHVPP